MTATEHPAPTCRLLFVSACPTGMNVLSSDRELRAIRRIQRDSINKDRITVKHCSAVTWNDFCQKLAETQPDVVHISAHADSAHLHLVSATGEY